MKAAYDTNFDGAARKGHEAEAAYFWGFACRIGTLTNTPRLLMIPALDTKRVRHREESELEKVSAVQFTVELLIDTSLSLVAAGMPKTSEEASLNKRRRHPFLATVLMLSLGAQRLVSGFNNPLRPCRVMSSVAERRARILRRRSSADGIAGSVKQYDTHVRVLRDP